MKIGYYLGIDIGSVAISTAVLNNLGEVVQSSYAMHKGKISSTLTELLKSYDLKSIREFAYTSSTPSLKLNGTRIDSKVACITAAKFFHPHIESLLIIGAEKFGLATFNKKGDYLNFYSNTSCAAGTGNFLDQQAERLNIEDISTFAEIAYKNSGNYPKIASRCAVFAKTDLIHAQQEGYTLSEICDGLSYGLAKNIVDAVLQFKVSSVINACGGVALNKAVIQHIENLSKLKVHVNKYANFYGAIGAALLSKESDASGKRCVLRSAKDIINQNKAPKAYRYDPLTLNLSEYPNFDANEKYLSHSKVHKHMKAVEVDVYTTETNSTLGELTIGIDIGSTSTKATLVDQNRKVIAGFYTRTSGQPIQAVQTLFESIISFTKLKKLNYTIAAIGTTGSGRKFVGRIIGADLELDEISAHAKAALELNPKTDTIIEIGGQDSKFTVLNNGLVTFSVMNNVCAAGTGSFIEEQAKRLECSLSEYAKRAENVRSPMASDRCTVFMERDLNHYLMAGYSTNEILAAVLHATRENYLTKVALKGQIGKNICFQGATGKNKALIAAFEQKLKKPITVSKYCHLTGAYGVALELLDKKIKTSTFKGLAIYDKTISVHTEVCEICTNHCKLKVADVNGKQEAYGFLCGRDYNSKSYVKNKVVNFQLIKRRQKLYQIKANVQDSSVTIGIPSALYLFEELPFWQKFFDLLALKTVTSDNYYTPVKDGKKISNAEFCAPMSAIHGHVNFLKDKCDYIFIPTYLRESSKGKLKDQYCYYTQYITSVIKTHKNFNPSGKIITPLLKYSQGDLSSIVELYQMFKTIGVNNLSLFKIRLAYERAKKHIETLNECWKQIYQRETEKSEDLHIMLLGRPYTILSRAMNNHIPEIIEKSGTPVFYMDMLPDKSLHRQGTSGLSDILRWKFASTILNAAEKTAQTNNCYPVLVTSFKCTPDSFVIEYFKEILDHYKKPYLILQLDEHDSAVGYETRIEAAVRAFRNHHRKEKKEVLEVEPFSEKNNTSQKQNQNTDWQNQINNLFSEATNILRAHSIDLRSFSKDIQDTELEEHAFSNSILTGVQNLKDKTLLLPSWDQFVGPLLEAVLRNSGINAYIVDSTNDSIQQSLSQNTGQCLPLNIIVQNAADFIRRKQLKPSETALWIMKSYLSCNLSMFPYYMKRLLVNYDNGLDKTSVYVGHILFYDFSLQTAVNAYLAHMLGGYIRQIGCSIRPYEMIPGTTNIVMQEAFRILYDSFLNGAPKEKVIDNILSKFKAIKIIKTSKPKVAIFGDLYVRDNDIMNQNLIDTIEANGGEAVTFPFSEYIKTIVEPNATRSYKEGRYLDYIKIKFLKSLIPLVEDKYMAIFNRFMQNTEAQQMYDNESWLNMFGLNILQGGEAIENILKIHRLIHQYPDLDLFIQTNPSYCCPSLITEAMASRIESITGIPVVTIEYDGTSSMKNEDIIPYLKFRNKSKTYGQPL